jgi:hypothetical protein
VKSPRQPVTDILSRPKKSATTEATGETKTGRPPGPEPSSKVTVVFYDRQTRALDHIAHAIYGRTETKISRTDLVRGIIDAVLNSHVDLTDVKSEADIRARVAAKLKG